MDFNSYQASARETAIYPLNIGKQYTALGLAGEAGEYCNKLKKIFRDQFGRFYPADVTALSEELGDVLWYVAACATELGINLDDVARNNVDKLSKRKASDSLSGSGDAR